MSKKMASVFIAYGSVLAGLGLVLQRVAPMFGKVTCIAGLAGGVACLILGIAALAGRKGRAWAVIFSIAVAYALLTQTVRAWMTAESAGSGILAFRLVATTLMLSTIGMLIYLLHGERPPEFYRTGTTRRADPASTRDEGQS